MSNMHVLTAFNGNYRVVSHIAIPVGNNSAGVPWQNAVVNSGLGGKTQLLTGDGTLGTISAAERTAIITTGSVYEDITDVDVSQRGQNTNSTQLAAFLDQWYTSHSAEVLAKLQSQLLWFGAVR